MAITKVRANINGDNFALHLQGDNVYSGNTLAPNEPGEYGLEVNAFDDGGNVFIANQFNTKNMVLEVNKWHFPKIDWNPTDAFNFQDYNRIKGNLEYLQERGSALFKAFEIDNMGENKSSYIQYPYADEINLLEKNLDVINQNIFTQNYGQRQYFFDNAPFIKWDELNRLENAILQMRDIMDRLEAGLSRLEITLGNTEGVKV